MKTKILYAFCFVLIVAAACSPQAFPPPDPTAAALPQSAPPTEALAFTPIPPLSPTPSSLSQALALQASPLNESGSGPIYTIAAQIPQLQGANDPRVAQFNLMMNLLVQNEVNRFREDILANQPVTPFVAGSSLDIKYELIAQRGEIWSIKFNVYFYMDGAAHPNSYSMTVNYDLEHGRDLRMFELFSPGADYLKVIADYCKAELSARDVGFTDPTFLSGADALEENYQRWNLSNEGLLVTFDVYQVAPYAAGPQTVLIPYAELRAVANSNGALQIFDR
jgi:hypothetical protein